MTQIRMLFTCELNNVQRCKIALLGPGFFVGGLSYHLPRRFGLSYFLECPRSTPNEPPSASYI
jgi:hypothetical protein